MTLRKARSFEYRPSQRRREQVGEGVRPRITLPKAGDDKPTGSGILRVVILLVAVIGLALALAALR